MWFDDEEWMIIVTELNVADTITNLARCAGCDGEGGSI